MSGGKLPEGWVESELSALGHIVTGKTPSTKEPSNFGGDIPFIKPGDLDLGGYITATADTLTQKGLALVPTLPTNSIVVTCIGNLGKVGITTIRSASNQQINALIPSERLNVKFIYYQILTLKPWLESQSAATTIAIVNKSKFSQAPFKFPPISEQKIIAEKLDTLLAQVDSTKTRLEQIPQILKRFRQAVLAAAVSGTLTTAFRNSHSLIGWHSTNLGALIVDSCNGLAKRQGLNGNEITILRLADFKDAKRIIGNERKIKLDSKEENKYSLENDDILVIRVNGSADLAGRFIEYKSNGDIEGFCDHFIRLRLDSNKIMTRFLTYIANEGEGRFYLRNSLSTSAGQNTINQTSIKGLNFLLPPLKEQQEIVRRVEQLFAYADTIEKQVNNALTRVNNLTQSILAKAFRGELTAQWRAENPDLISGENSAAALLEKIKAERAASGGKKTSRKKV